MTILQKTALLAFASTLISCSGTMQGVVRGEGTPVQFHYEQGPISDTYRAVIDGETFTGKAVFADARSGAAYSSSGLLFMDSTSGNIIATLLGDKGSSMRCQMNYADSSGFTTLGGVGVCQHNDGRIVDVVW